MNECDQAAASPLDNQRPTGQPGVDHVDYSVAVPACEAAVRADPRNPKMHFQLGRAYEAAKRPSDALVYYQQAAAMGYVIAAYDLSGMYGRGDGVGVDPEKQLYYLNQAAQARLGIAEYRLGVFYAEGQAGLSTDEKLAEQWFYLSASDQYFLGVYRYGLIMQRSDVRPEKAEAVKVWVQRKLEQASPKELWALCQNLQFGTDGIKDLVRAGDYCRRSAEAGFPEAEASYGDLLWKGIGVDVNIAEARHWFEKGASGGAPIAMRNLGVFLQHGLGGEQSYAEARTWYEKAALAGDASAMNGIGYLLQNGLGGEKDYAGAREWFEKSAKGNDPDGTNSLGVMFEFGLGGVKDPAEARRLYQKALKLGEKRFAAKNLKRL